MSTNTTAATATLITSFPTTITQDVTDTAAPDHEVWFKLVGPADTLILGLWAHAIPSTSTYMPALTVYRGTADNLTLVFNEVVDATVNLPVTESTAYFFKITQGRPLQPFPNAPLTLHVERGPETAKVSNGRIVVPSDTDGLPLAILSETTGETLAFREVPPGEGGAILPDGTMCLENNANDTIEIRDRDFELVAAAVFPLGGETDGPVRVVPIAPHCGTSRFFVGSPRLGVPVS
jgi:hypothetical protein